MSVGADDPYFHEEFHPIDEFGDDGFEPSFDDFEPDYESAPRSPAPEPSRPAPTSAATGFNETEKQFLYQVMNHEDYTAQLEADTRAILPQVLATLFHDRTWVLEFLNEDRGLDFERQLEVVPESCRGFLREINVIGAYEKLEGDKLATMVLDLLKTMIKKQVSINRQRLKNLPITADDQKRALMRQNAQLNAQYHKVG